MKQNFVIGYPLKQSLSPLLHNHIYSLLNLQMKLEAKEIKNLDILIDNIHEKNIQLTAVTLPFKEEIIKYLDWIHPTAQEAKAVNTVIRKANKLYGFNTDIDGIAFAFKNICLHSKKILVIGAGGAARALGLFLKKQNSEIYWYNRNPNKARKLIAEFTGNIVENLISVDNNFDIIINTTPIGMYPNISDTPLPNMNFNKSQIIFDMIYNPQMTKFLKCAEKQGCKIITGLEMFIGQALKQIELITGKHLVDDQNIIKEAYKILM